MVKATYDAEAQDAAAALADAECKGRGAQWTAAEAAFREARKATDAEAIAWEVLTLCATCPVARQCAEWAEIDNYTGLAAGSIYYQGEARPPWQVWGARKAA